MKRKATKPGTKKKRPMYPILNPPDLWLGCPPDRDRVFAEDIWPLGVYYKRPLRKEGESLPRLYCSPHDLVVVSVKNTRRSGSYPVMEEMAASGVCLIAYAEDIDGTMEYLLSRLEAATFLDLFPRDMHVVCSSFSTLHPCPYGEKYHGEFNGCESFYDPESGSCTIVIEHEICVITAIWPQGFIFNNASDYSVPVPGEGYEDLPDTDPCGVRAWNPPVVDDEDGRQ